MSNNDNNTEIKYFTNFCHIPLRAETKYLTRYQFGSISHCKILSSLLEELYKKGLGFSSITHNNLMPGYTTVFDNKSDDINVYCTTDYYNYLCSIKSKEENVLASIAAQKVASAEKILPQKLSQDEILNKIKEAYGTS